MSEASFRCFMWQEPHVDNMKQLCLFGGEVLKPKKTDTCGGSNNPIVFRDYESFVSKFADAPRTTDDCHPKRNGLFEDHLLINTEKAKEKETVKSHRSTGEMVTISIPLSKRGNKIVSELNENNDDIGRRKESRTRMGDHQRPDTE